MQNAFVLLGKETIPLLYISPTQVNAVVPYDIAGGGAYTAIARDGNRLSAPVRIPVAAANPAFFTVDGSGKGQAHILC